MHTSSMLNLEPLSYRKCCASFDIYDLLTGTWESEFGCHASSVG